MPKRPLRENEEEQNLRVRTLSFVVTRDCNLGKCKYCYEKNHLRDSRIMDFSTARDNIIKYMDEEGFDVIIIDWFGGEPLLGFDLIRKTVDWVLSREWKKKFRFMIGTNGTLLNDKMKDWMYRNRQYLTIGVSLDGTKTAHDLCRCNSYDKVWENLPFFQKYWPHQPVKMTICADTIPYTAESVIELEEKGIFFTANMGFEDMWGDAVSKRKLLAIYEDRLARLVEYYRQRPGLYPVSPLLTAVPIYLGLTGEEEPGKIGIKRFCGAGHEMV